MKEILGDLRVLYKQQDSVFGSYLDPKKWGFKDDPREAKRSGNGYSKKEDNNESHKITDSTIEAMASTASSGGAPAGTRSRVQSFTL